MDESLTDLLSNGLQAHRQGRLDEAASVYEHLLQIAPDNFDALQLLGLLRHQQGRITEAATLLEKALEFSPRHAGVLNHLAAVFISGGDAAAAADKARAVLSLVPQDALALYHLGCAQRMLGQTEEAALTLENALSVKPQAPDARNLLGIVRHEQGRYEEAAAHFETALQLRPGHPEYLNNLGFALLEAGQARAARPWLEAAVAARPRFGEALVNLGRALHETGLDEQALAALRAAGKLDPKVPAVPINLGISLQALNRTKEAEQAFLAALKMQQGNSVALANLAALYEGSNRLELANHAVARGLAQSPDDPFLNLVAARCERRRGEYAQAAQRVTRIVAGKPGDKWSQALHYELARNQDRAGKYAAAMAAAEHANQLALRDRAQGTDAGNPYNELLSELAVATEDGWVESWPPRAESGSGPTPVFLVGFPRSGTTLLDTIIGSHPEFVVLEEKPAVEAMRLALEQRPGGLIGALTALDEAGRAGLAAVYWREVDTMLDAPLEKRRLLDKLPLNIVMLPLIMRVFPEARVVLGLRHPADVCLSCFFQEFDYRRAPAMANFLTMEATVEFYGKVLSLWQQYQQRLRPRVHTVRYEDLVDDLEGQARRLFDFLGSAWDPCVLRYHQQVAARGTIDTPSYHQVGQPIYTQARYRWRNYSTELSPWLDTLQAWAARLGYEQTPGQGNQDDQ